MRDPPAGLREASCWDVGFLCREPESWEPLGASTTWGQPRANSQEETSGPQSHNHKELSSAHNHMSWDEDSELQKERHPANTLTAA